MSKNMTVTNYVKKIANVMYLIVPTKIRNLKCHMASVVLGEIKRSLWMLHSWTATRLLPQQCTCFNIYIKTNSTYRF